MKTANTKRALFLSAVSMLLCVVMLAGTTFAWFTDTVEAAGNVIKAGILEIDLIHEGKSLADEANYKVFDYDKWEPGYTQYESFSLVNKGNLHFKYELRISPTGEVSKLAEVIDVYTSAGAPSQRADISAMTPIGTLASVLANNGVLISGNTDGMTLELPGEGETGDVIREFSIAFKMRESADNSYQGLSIGTEFDLELVAAQYTEEIDSFDETYDSAAGFDVSAKTEAVTPDTISSMDFTQDNTVYKFSGDFGGADLIIRSDSALTQTFDGTGAANLGRVEILAPGVLGSYESLSGVKTGTVTVTGFESEQISLFAYDTSVNITNNIAEFIHVCGADIALDIDGNTVDGGFESHTSATNSQSSEYGIYLYITDYTLSFTNNTVTDTYSHAIGINGRQSEMNGFATAGTGNSITAFSKNTVNVNSTAKDERVALKIWDDAVYASKTAQNTVNAKASALVKMIADGENTITLGETHAYCDFYGAIVDTLA